MKARIYQPSKTAMQSGFARTGYWVLEYESGSTKQPEPLMGWTTASDTLGQVSLKFPDLDEAKKFAESKGLAYTVLSAHSRKVRPRNYGDNFRYRPEEQDE